MEIGFAVLHSEEGRIGEELSSIQSLKIELDVSRRLKAKLESLRDSSNTIASVKATLLKEFNERDLTALKDDLIISEVIKNIEINIDLIEKTLQSSE